MSLRYAIFDLEDALKGFYKGIRNEPKFKSKWKGKKLYYKINTKCKSELDKDQNVEVNILFEGIKQYMKELG